MEISPKQEISSALDRQKITAFDMTQEFVAQKLVSPSTAKFPSSREARITVLKPNHFLVESYVDSQNSLGAMVRNKYIAEMADCGNDWWKLVSLKIF